jgi:phage gpG-like protein
MTVARIGTGAGTTIIVDLAELERVVGDLSEAASDLSDVMAVVASDMLAAVDENFETGGKGKWPPLAPSTIAKRRGSSAQILVDTAVMRGATTPTSGANFAEVGNNTSYAPFHVSKAARQKIPLRDFLELDDEFLEGAADEILSSVLERAGFRGAA